MSTQRPTPRTRKERVACEVRVLEKCQRLEAINADLLAALKEAPEPTWTSPMSRFEERYDQWYDDIQAAIAKAEPS